jgi:hypothetical protein
MKTLGIGKKISLLVVFLIFFSWFIYIKAFPSSYSIRAIGTILVVGSLLLFLMYLSKKTDTKSKEN